MVLASMAHRLLMLWARLASSPELYPLKKSTGRERTRIMEAAWTAMFIFVWMRPMMRLRVTPNSSVERETPAMRKTRGSSSPASPLGMTLLNRRLFT